MGRRKDTIKKMYEQRERIIILGLTGRTGAGCSTVAGILSKESIEELDLRSYKTADFANADERKYSVIKRFMEVNHRWKGFIVIEASSIIFSFLLCNKINDLFSYLDALDDKGEIIDLAKLKDQILKFANVDELKEDSYLDLKTAEFVNMLENKETLRSENKNNLWGLIKYFTVTLRERKLEFKEILDRYLYRSNDGGKESNLYSYLMQDFGNNVRKSGCVFNDVYESGTETIVADRIDHLIDVIVQWSKNQDDERIRICIDAFRNPLEIQYFRDRYRAFYVMAVNTEDRDRMNRLGLRKSEIKSLDETEYPKDRTSEELFYHQDIQGCLEVSDIYLYNPDVSNHRYYELTEQIIKYIALMLQPGIVAPTHLERCMQLAFNAKYNSGCLSRQVGAVVTGDDFSVRSVGWNDVPKGQVPCNLRCVEDYCNNKDPETFSEYELNDELFSKTLEEIRKEIPTDNDKYFSYCFKGIYNGLTGEKNQVYTRALHAEENAFLQIAKYGGAKIQGGKLFTTASPCELCSKKAYQLGIREIYYIDPYPGISKSHILSFGKIGNPKMILFSGAIGNAYISLYSPRMPYKDELELYTGVSVKEIADRVKKENG